MGKNKNLIENTIASLIFVFLLTITLYTPFGLLTVLLLSGPFIFIAFRNENKIIITVFLVNLLLSLIIGSIIGLSLTIIAASVGIAMGKLYKRISLLTTLLTGILIVIINIVIILVIGNFLFDINISETYNQMLQTSLASTENFLNQLGDQEQINLLMGQYKEFLEVASMMIPFIFITFATIYVITNHLYSSIILNKIGYKVPKFYPFKDWVFPRSILYYYFIVAIIYLINPDYYSLKIITLNLFPLLTIILLIQGLSFVFYYIYKKKLAKFLSILAVIAIFVPILNQGFQILGIIDLSFNLRQRFRD